MNPTSAVTLDILSNPKYAGAISSIRGVTDWIDSGFGMAITMIAFLIIIVAMLKNVLAAAYCAYPKFWDRVDAAHKEVESVSWSQQIKDTFNSNMNGGSFTSALFRILPNIKNITDFEGDTFSPKSYFIRAIPQMLVCIIIGAFIYNGYYRDTASVVVDFGSEMVRRTLLEVNPVAVFDQFTGAAGRPVFSSDDAVDAQTILVNKIATKSYTAVIGTYNDVDSAEAKRALASAVENKASLYVNEMNADYVSNSDAWEPIVDVVLTNGKVDTNMVNGTVVNETTAQYAFTYQVADLGISSNKEVGVDNWVRIRVNFEKQVVKTGKRTVTDIDLQLNAQIAYTIPTNAVMTIGNFAEVKLMRDGEVAGTVTYDKGTIKLAMESNVSAKAGDTFTLSSPIPLSSRTSGTTHSIATITIGKAGTLTSKSEEAYGNGTFTFNTSDLGKTDAVKAGAAASPSPSPAT